MMKKEHDNEKNFDENEKKKKQSRKFEKNERKLCMMILMMKKSNI